MNPLNIFGKHGKVKKKTDMGKVEKKTDENVILLWEIGKTHMRFLSTI